MHSQPCANTGTNSDANGPGDCCEIPNAVSVGYNVIHLALYQRPYWYSITHYTFCIYIVFKLYKYLKNNINVKYTIFYVCPQAHNQYFLTMPSRCPETLLCSSSVS
jgi:hypothetical protein